MNKEEAIILLGLSENPKPQEIREKYKSFFSDYKIRLTNAPTPNLKKLYQSKLQELDIAKDVLLDKGQINESDLPSLEPVFELSKQKDRHPEDPLSSNVAPKQGTTELENDKKTKFKAKKEWAIYVAIGSISLAALFIILWTQALTKVNEKEAQIVLLQKEIDDIQYLLDLDEKISNEKFKIQNIGNSILTVTALNITYRINNQFKKYEYYSGNSIRPGGTLKFEKIRGDNIVWNGDVVFYSFDCEYDGEVYHIGGHFISDAPEGILKLNLD